MRTLIFLFGAVALFGLVQGVARWLSFAPHLATLAFLLIWLLVAGFNMWFGVTHAGYSTAIRRELHRRLRCRRDAALAPRAQ